MGGGAFAKAVAVGKPTLNVQRMNPVEYAELKSIYLAKLQEYLPDGKVGCLTEAPEKGDYGDMDIFIAIDQQVDFVHMANQVGAAGLIRHTTEKCTIAVLKYGTVSVRPLVIYKPAQRSDRGEPEVSSPTTSEQYAQIDIDVILPEIMDWHVFNSSYGDMGAMLGHILHDLGFTVRDQGFYLRMTELDSSKKSVSHANIADRDGQIFLSKDPTEVIQFLDLSVQGYEQGFKTLDDFYTWLAACRVLHAGVTRVKRDTAHERRREQTRTVYTRFFFEWLPAHVNMDFEEEEDGQKEHLKQLRERYREEAVDFFSKEKEYEVKHNAIVLQVENAIAGNLLRPIVAKHSGKYGKNLNEIMRAFRRFVDFGENGQPYVSETAHSDEQSQLHGFLDDGRESLADLRATNVFVKDKWWELRWLERQKSKYHGASAA